MAGTLLFPSSHTPSSTASSHPALHWIARLGGFLGRRADGEPGVKTYLAGVSPPRRHRNSLAIDAQLARQFPEHLWVMLSRKRGKAICAFKLPRLVNAPLARGRSSARSGPLLPDKPRCIPSSAAESVPTIPEARHAFVLARRGSEASQGLRDRSAAKPPNTPSTPTRSISAAAFTKAASNPAAIPSGTPLDPALRSG